MRRPGLGRRVIHREFGTIAVPSASLELKSAPLLELSMRTQPTLASPLDQFCKLAVTSML